MGGENSKEKNKSRPRSEKHPRANSKTDVRHETEKEAGVEKRNTREDTSQAPTSARRDDIRSKHFLVHDLEKQIRLQIQNCLRKLPIQSTLKDNHKVLEYLATKAKMIKFKSSADIIFKNKTGKGIFIILDGIVEVVSERGDITIVTLSKSDFFGEVSTMFEALSTARVKAFTDVELLFLKKESLIKVTKGEVTMEPMDWFVTKKYLPTSGLFDRDQMTRRLTLHSLSTVSTFGGWHEHALKTLILATEPPLVVLYPANATIIQRGDPPGVLYVLIRGSVALMDGTRMLGRMSVDEQCLVFREEDLRYGLCSKITVRTDTSCEVVTIRENWIKESMTKFVPETAAIPWEHRGSLWKKREAVIDTDLFDIFSSELQLEVISESLKRTALLQSFSMDTLYSIALHFGVFHFKARKKVYSEDDSESETVAIILCGRVKMVSPDKHSQILQSTAVNQAYYDPVTMRGGCQLLADTECLILKMERAQIMAITNQTQKLDPTEPL